MSARVYRRKPGEMQASRIDLSSALALLALSALRWKFGPQGWRIFTSRRANGAPPRWWATRGTSDWQPLGEYAALDPGLLTRMPDAVDADTPAELAAKLRKRSGQ